VVADGLPGDRAQPLAGRVALVTGVSRPSAIGVAVARRLHLLGAAVDATGWPPHDGEMPWGTGALGPLPFEVHRDDLERPDAPAQLVDRVLAVHGALDIVVAVHARSSQRSLADVDATELDRCWAANVRSIVLLAQAFARTHRPDPAARAPRGRMIWFTSGQHLAPMDGEIAYAATKGALHQLTRSLDHAMAPHGIVANCVNPGPVDTGYATGDAHAAIAAMFPDGRWQSPDDVADVVELLVSDKGAHLRGQVIDAEAGFDRFARPGGA
jgi:3-oxoacyl-[acyl-carrier protein] reductase